MTDGEAHIGACVLAAAVFGKENVILSAPLLNAAGTTAAIDQPKQVADLDIWELEKIFYGGIVGASKDTTGAYPQPGMPGIPGPPGQGGGKGAPSVATIAQDLVTVLGPAVLAPLVASGGALATLAGSTGPIAALVAAVAKLVSGATATTTTAPATTTAAPALPTSMGS